MIYNKRLGVIGLGKLGIPLALVLTEYHFDVIGYDIDKEVVNKLNNKISPIEEPQVNEKLNNLNLKFTYNIKDLSNREVVFIIVPTPSDEDGRFSNEFIISAIKSLRSINKNCLIVITSTVMPGTCKELNQTYNHIAYNPTFIALGRVIQDLKNPNFILIGESNNNGKIVEDIWKQITTVPIYKMDLISAEIAKITLNAYITMKINFANNLGEICERWGADVDKITSAIGKDKRIGLSFLKSGMPYGGPCFPRDNKAFKTLTNSIISEEVDYENRYVQIKRIVLKCKNILGKLKDKKIMIIGKAYKSNTPYLDESPSIWLGNELESNKAVVYYYDDYHGDKLISTDLYILATTNNASIYLGASEFLKYNKNPTVLDCWRIRDDLKKDNRFNYYALGEK